MNDTLLPNKMTKSYLLESDPYLKTSSKSSPFALNSDESVFRAANVWNGNHHSSAIPNEVISDRPTVKPLAMHNVPSNVPPIAYINGNSVRPVRCRHYSQQQTVVHNNNNSISEKKANSGIKVAASDMHHYAESNENGVNDCGGIAGAGDNTGDRDSDKGNTDKNGFSFASMAPKSLPNKVKVESSTSSQQPQQRQQSPSKQRANSPSRQSPSSIRDYVTNNENEASIYNLYENTEQVIEHLAKRIESVLRSAKESRRLICNELLVPHLLTSQIAADVIEMAECEPCGLRGCHLYICIEDTSGGNSASGQNGLTGNKKSSSSDHSHQQANSSHQSLSSRLLGEIAIDRSVVPTFEVFLTLKRTAPNWFESLENKLLGKERIVLSELYLVHKKKLYQPSSPTM